VIPFRFDAERHEYTDLSTGEVCPHITGVLKDGGLVDDRWFTAESADRGHVVHKLTADYDFGMFETAKVGAVHAPYLQAYVNAKGILQPVVHAIEEALIHPVHRYAGRIDRDVTLYGVRGVLEIKSAEPHDAHQVQTALQAILLAAELQVRPSVLGRWCLYLKRNGKWRLDEHLSTADFGIAERLIRDLCRPN